MPRNDIVVLSYGQEKFTVKCFDSIKEHCSDYRLVWVDNGSSSRSRTTALEAFEKHDFRLPVFSGQNLGFVGGVNLALNVLIDVMDTDADYITLLNNDTVVTEGCIDTLTNALDGDARIRVAGPMASNENSWQGWMNVLPRHGVDYDFMEFKDMEDDERATRLREMFGDETHDVNMIAFFCATFRRSCFSEIGRMDERFGVGLGDDDDYSKRIRDAGYRVAFVPGAYVVHNHRTTFKSLYSEEEIKRMQKKAMAIYKGKHGVDVT